MPKSYYCIQIYHDIESDDALNKALENLHSLDVTVEHKPLSKLSFFAKAKVYKQKYNVTINKRQERSVKIKLNSFSPQESQQNEHDKIAIEQIIEKCLNWFGDGAEVRFIYYKYVNDPSLKFKPITLDGYNHHEIAIGKNDSCSAGIAIKGNLLRLSPKTIMDVLKELGCYDIRIVEIHSESDKPIDAWIEPIDWYRIAFKRRFLWPSEIYSTIREKCSPYVNNKPVVFSIRLFEDNNDPAFESFPDTPGFNYYRKRKL